MRVERYYCFAETYDRGCDYTMQEPSRQLLRHFTGRLTQAELLELRPEFAIANSGQNKGILVILLGV